MTGKLLATVAAAALVFVGTVANADILSFGATLKGANTPAASKASGEVTAVLDTDQGVLDYTVTYQGLSGPALAADFNDSGAGGAAIVAASGTSSPIHGTIRLNSSQVRDLNADRWSFDVTTRAVPSGEIQGVIRRRSS